MDHGDFINRLNGTLVDFPLSLATRQLVVAHAAYESAWGSCAASRLGWNHWNLTRSENDHGPVVEGPDTEYDAGGNYLGAITQRFRSYSDEAAAVRDYLSFLSTQNGGRYLPGYEQLINGDEAFARTIGAEGYYTLPADRYVREFGAVLAEVRSSWPADDNGGSSSVGTVLLISALALGVGLAIVLGG